MDAQAETTAPVALAERADAAATRTSDTQTKDERWRQSVDAFAERLRSEMPSDAQQVLSLAANFAGSDGKNAFRTVADRYRAVAEAYSIARRQQWPQREPIESAWRKLMMQNWSMNILLDRILAPEEDDDTRATFDI